MQLRVHLAGHEPSVYAGYMRATLKACAAVALVACAQQGERLEPEKKRPAQAKRASPAAAPPVVQYKQPFVPIPAGSAAPGKQAKRRDLPVLPDIGAPEWKPETREQELRMQIEEQGGKPTRQQVVDMIGLSVPNLPGVTKSKLPKGDKGKCGTSALWFYERHKDQLTPAQRRIADKHFNPPGTRVVGCVLADGTILRGPCPAGTKTK